MKKYFIEEAKRAKKIGLTKRQFITYEIIKLLIILSTFGIYNYLFLEILKKI